MFIELYSELFTTGDWIQKINISIAILLNIFQFNTITLNTNRIEFRCENENSNKKLNLLCILGLAAYTRDRNVWGDRPFYLVKQPQEKWACDFLDDALPLSFQLQVVEVIF